MILCDGDILKQCQIVEFTFEEVKPFLEYRCESIAIRKGILQMVKDNDKEYQYCKVCKKMGKNDCANCSKEFKVINHAK